MLSVVAYGGQVEHEGVITDGSGIRPLVSQEDAKAVRAPLADPARTATPGNTPKHLLSGIARCGTCDGPIVLSKGYRCQVRNGAHVYMDKATADRIVVEEVSWAFLFQGKAGHQ